MRTKQQWHQQPREQGEVNTPTPSEESGQNTQEVLFFPVFLDSKHLGKTYLYSVYLVDIGYELITHMVLSLASSVASLLTIESTAMVNEHCQPTHSQSKGPRSFLWPFTIMYFTEESADNSWPWGERGLTDSTVGANCRKQSGYCFSKERQAGR